MSRRTDSRSRSAAAGAALLLFALASGACTSMSPVKEPTNYIESVTPKMIRVTRTDGQKFTMIGAHISGDTLMGFTERPGGAMGEFTELPIGDVKVVEAQQYAHGKTALAIIGGVGAWALITYGYVKVIESNSAK